MNPGNVNRGMRGLDLLAILIQFFVLILIAILGYSILLDDNMNINAPKNIYMFNLLGTVTFIIAILLWKLVTDTAFCPYVLFLSSFFIFQFGQSCLNLLGIEYEEFNLFHLFSEDVLLKAIIFTALSIATFNLGALINVTIRKKITVNSKVPEMKQMATKKAMKQIGWLLFLVSTPVAFYFIILKAIMSLQYGYGVIYSYDFGANSILIFVESFFLPSAYMLISIHVKDIFKAKMFTIIIALYAVISLLTGSRTLFIMIVLTLIWLWNSIIRPFNWRKVSKLAVMGFFLMLVISAFENFRGVEEKEIGTLAEAFSNSLSQNPVIDSIGEMGGSMSPLLMIMQFMPDSLSYRLGDSYLYALFSLLPNLFNFMGTVHPSREHAMLDVWLGNYLGLSYGPGFSMVAESYYNFGWFGIGISFVWGVIIAKLLGYNSSEKLSENPIRLFIILAVISTCFTLPRIHTLYFVRTFFYYIAVPFLGIILLRNKHLKSMRQHLKNR